MMPAINTMSALNSIMPGSTSAAAPMQANPFAESSPAEAGSGLNFQQLLLNTLAETNQLDAAGQQSIEEFVSGGDITQVEVMTAVKKADLSLRMMLQIRNKLLEAFSEIQNLRM